MQGTAQQPHRVPDGTSLHYERHRPEQTELYSLVRQHADNFIAHTETSAGSKLPRFIKDEFDAHRECGILAHGFLRLRCSECGHDKLLAFSCKRRGFCLSCGARRKSPPARYSKASSICRFAAIVPLRFRISGSSALKSLRAVIRRHSPSASVTLNAPFSAVSSRSRSEFAPPA